MKTVEFSCALQPEYRTSQTILKLSGPENEVEMIKKKLTDIAFKGTVIAIPLFREASEHEFRMVEKYIE